MSDTESCYSCVLGSHGIAWLKIHSQSGTTNASAALLDVLLLQELELLTQSLETVFGQAIDWQRDTAFAESHSPDFLELELEFAQPGLIALATLFLPVYALPELAREPLARPAALKLMKWRPVACTLCLSTLDLSIAEQDKLGDGALLIIPESFTALWSSTLEIGHSLQWRGQYLQADDSWRVSEPREAGMQQSDTLNQANTGKSTAVEPSNGVSQGVSQAGYRVVFECQLDPVDLMQSSKPVSIGMSGQQHEAVLSLVSGEGARFRGSLLSLGAGYALLLDLVDATIV